MRVLPAVRSARWRSRIGTVLDHGVDLCFNAGHRLLALRERMDPTGGELTPERADALLENVMARIEPPVPAYRPSPTDVALATFAASLTATVWTQRDRDGRLHVAVQRQDGRG
jgi:hypothetical protein